jgi:PAS domain S-box-containing protein
VSILGRTQLPKPRRLAGDELWDPRLECLLVETDVIVRSVFQTTTKAVVSASVKGLALSMDVHTGSPENVPKAGDLVRVRGVASAFFNAKGQWIAPRLHLQDFRYVSVLRSETRQEPEVPLVSVGSLLTYPYPRPASERVRVRGVVTCITPEGEMCVQDGPNGVVVLRGDPKATSVGQSVEVLGFPAFTSYSPTIEDAAIRQIGVGERIVPLPITPDQARSGRYDGRLVEMTGTVMLRERVIDQLPDKFEYKWVLTIGDGPQAFNAELADAVRTGFERLEPGSKVKLLGVCLLSGQPQGPSGAFVLRLRTPADVTLLEGASWWTAERARTVIGLSMTAIALSVVWVWVLRKKVRRQTEIIRSRLQLETALEERYRDLFENATDLVFTTDMQETFTSLNRAAEQIFGLAAERGRRLNSFIVPEDRCALEDVRAQLIGGERSVLRQMAVVGEDGRRCVLEMNCRVRHAEGVPKFMDVIARDVTQQKREQEALEDARAAAEAASRAKSEFLANMSHEIRTPMNGILGMTELMLESKLDSDQRTSLEVVRTSADALLTIINDILDFSKIEAGRMDLDASPFDISDVVEGCLDLIALPVAQRGIELICDIDPTLPAEWIGDAARLRQVLMNLLGNAAKFTHAGEIALRIQKVETCDGQVCAQFSVRDTGIGIPPEQHRRVFDMFCQADGSTSRKYGGTGLGLAIASRLVSLMGGALTLQSVPGMGSTFTFKIPVVCHTNVPVVAPGCLHSLKVAVNESNASCANAIRRLMVHTGAVVVSDPEASVIITSENAVCDSSVVFLISAGRAAPGTTAPATVVRKPVNPRTLVAAVEALSRARDVLALRAACNSAVRKLPGNVVNYGRSTVLLAEDNRVNQLLAVRTLEKAGYRVLVANNGREAVAIANREHPDLVLMDIQMPEMDGFEATAILREHSRIPIIALTAHALKGDRERCLGAGMTDYISKPVRPADLIAMVDRYATAAVSSPT